MTTCHSFYKLLIIESQNHTLEKTSKIIESNRQLNRILKCHIYTFFKHLQGWGLHRLLGQPIPIPEHSFSKGIFTNI